MMGNEGLIVHWTISIRGQDIPRIHQARMNNDFIWPVINLWRNVINDLAKQALFYLENQRGYYREAPACR